jgi:hypothetical protein
MDSEGWLGLGVRYKEQLPNDLIQRLPPVRVGYERVVLDGRLLLVAVATQVIADILSDAIFN